MDTYASEKREFLRVPLGTEVEVVWSGGLIRAESGLNISMTGLGFSSVQPMPAVGSDCRVSIKLASADDRIVIKASGKVVRAAPGVLGVGFTELDLDSYHHLKRLVLFNAKDTKRAEQEFEAHWGIRKPSVD